MHGEKTGVMRELKQHQIKTVAYHLSDTATLDLSDMGTGKTKPVLHTIWYLLADDDCRPVIAGENDSNAWPRYKAALVVAPSHVLHTWAEAIELDLPPDIRYQIVDGSPAQRLKALNRDVAIYVISYDMIWRTPEIVEWGRVHKPLAIVLDEAHKIKNPMAKRTIAAWEKLWPLADKRIALTGTIKKNNIQDIHPILTWVNPTAIPQPVTILGGPKRGQRYKMSTLNWRFVDQYCIRNPFTFAIKVRKDKIAELQQIIADNSIRHPLSVIDLPGKETVKREFELSLAQQRTYRQADRDFIVWLGEQKLLSVPNVLARLLRLRQIASGYCDNYTFPANPRLDLLAEVLEEIGEEHKVVITAVYHQEIVDIMRLLRTNYPEQWLSFYRLPDNGIPEPYEPESRQEVQDRFSHDASIRFCVTSPNLTAEGINLQAANYMVRYSRTFAHDAEEHMAARIYRYGQSKKCVYVDLAMRNVPRCRINIDKLVETNLNDKQVLTDLLYGHSAESAIVAG
jgi:SNF2 family DNA or RNA helicase